jgi:hypothetical protein
MTAVPPEAGTRRRSERPAVERLHWDRANRRMRSLAAPGHCLIRPLAETVSSQCQGCRRAVQVASRTRADAMATWDTSDGADLSQGECMLRKAIAAEPAASRFEHGAASYAGRRAVVPRGMSHCAPALVANQGESAGCRRQLLPACSSRPTSCRRPDTWDPPASRDGPAHCRRRQSQTRSAPRDRRTARRTCFPSRACG